MRLAGLRQFGWKQRMLHLGAVWALSFGKPILDATNESGFLLLPRSAAPVDVVLLAAIVLLAPPLALLGIEQLAGLASERLRDGLHLALLGGMFAVLAIQVLGSLGLRNSETAILLSLLVAATAIFAYAATEFMPTVLDVLSPVPVIFLVLYLFFSPATGLWLSDPEPEEIEPKRDPPVVLVVLDEFPTSSLLSAPGKIDESRYPNFARLAKRASWYENAITVADQTTRAVPAILTGRRPEGKAKPVPTAGAYPESLFTLLGNAYEIDAVETETQLCPRDVCEREMRDPFGERFARLVGDLAIYTPAAVLPARTHNAILGRGTSISPLPPKGPTELFELLVDEVDGQPGQLDMIHLPHLPHKPWRLVPTGQSYEDPGVVAEDLAGEGLAVGGQTNIEERKRHLLQVGATDRLIGLLINRLRASGSWDDALFVVTADHGINFRSGAGRRRGTEENLDQIALVPLFVKLPGQRQGGADPAPVETIDVVPTIAKTLGVEVPWEIDGLPAGERNSDAIELTNFNGRAIRTDLAALRARQDQFVAEWAKLLPTGRGWEALISSGLSPGLIGTRVPDDPPSPEASGAIRGLADEDDPDRVTAVIGGELRGIKPGKRLAVAINGRVAAVTRSVGNIEAPRYEVVLPPSLYEAPIERVQLLRARPGPRFEQLASASP